MPKDSDSINKYELEITNSKIESLNVEIQRIYKDLENNYVRKEKYDALESKVSWQQKLILTALSAAASIAGISGVQLVENNTNANTPTESSEVREP